MARIRTIKPELPQSETIGALSRDARLLFIQLFTIADDAGRARAASRLLASLLYPYDEDAAGLIDGWLGELEDRRCIRRYEVDGSQYLEVTKWLEHQKIDRPSASRLPEYRERSEPSREDSRGSDADLVPSTCTLDHGPHTAAAAVAAPDARDRFEEFWKEYPARDGDNPKLPAKLKFESLVKTGVDPDLIVAGAKRYAAKAAEKQQVGTQYIAHALKWLSEQRWADVAAVAFLASERSADPQPKDWLGGVRRWLANESQWPRWAGPVPGSPACRCPPEILLAEGVDPESGNRIDRMVFIEAGTPEAAAHQMHRQERKMRPARMWLVTAGNVEKSGFYADRRVPPGYDEATGEKLAPSDAEDAA
jgi:hypothetical protein